MVVQYNVSVSQELLTLEDAVAIALKNNPTIQIAKNNEAMGQNNAHIGNAGLLPSIDVSANSRYTDSNIKTGSGSLDERSTLNSADIQLSYTLFNGFSNLFTYKKLKSAAVSSSLLARFNIENELLNVINSYYTLARAIENVNITNELVIISKERYERIQKRNVFGQANKLAVLNAEVDLNADSIALSNAKISFDQAKRNLNVLLNRAVEYDYQVNFDIRFTKTYQLTDLHERAGNRNAAYLLTLEDLKQTRYDYRITQSNYFPRLNLQSSWGYSQSLTDYEMKLNDPNRTWTTSLSLSLNLFDGWRRRIQSQNARLRIDNQQQLLKEAKLILEQDVQNTYANYKNSRYVLEVQQDNLESTQLNFDRTRELYDLGQVTSTEFREAQLNLIRAKTTITNAKFDAKLLEFQLMRLVGELVGVE